MRLGIFGGTFDPIHQGHLILAEQCREQARLDRVLFVPAPRPPHKSQPMTPFDKRVEMLALAISGQPSFQTDELEKDRPGPSYTVETLEQIQARDPAAELFLILGADSVVDLPLWFEPVRILKLATLLVVGRPGWAFTGMEELREKVGLPETIPFRLETVQCPLMEISSRDIRQRTGEGRTIRYLVPRAVEAYIGDKGLYR